MAYGISAGPYISIRVAPPILMGEDPTKPPMKRRTKILGTFLARAVPMFVRQNARDPATYTGVRPMDGRFDNGES
jgi:hypothetical protein